MKVKELTSGRSHEFTIVGSAEADPKTAQRALVGSDDKPITGRWIHAVEAGTFHLTRYTTLD